MIVMFALGRSRGTAWDALFVSAISLAIAAIPEALPTVTDVILSLGSVELAKRNALVKELPAVETLGLHLCHQLGQDGHPHAEPDDRGRSDRSDRPLHHQRFGLRPRGPGRACLPAPTDSIEDAILPFLVANDATLVDGEVVGDPTEGALLVLGYKAGVDIEATRERLPRLATLPFDPTYKLMATFHEITGPSGHPMSAASSRGPRRP